MCLFVREVRKISLLLPIYLQGVGVEFVSREENRMGLRSVLLVLVMAAAVGAPLMVEAQLGIIGSLLGLIRIQGTVFCTANGNIGINGTATPVFPSMPLILSFMFLSLKSFFVLILQLFTKKRLFLSSGHRNKPLEVVFISLILRDRKPKTK